MYDRLAPDTLLTANVALLVDRLAMLPEVIVHIPLLFVVQLPDPAMPPDQTPDTAAPDTGAWLSE